MLRQSVSVALAGLIVLNFGSPISLVARAAESRAAAPAEAGEIALATDPLGADVYVDGVFAGQTPVTVNTPAGDHRVRIVKSGYLENARVVSVAPGRPTSLRVKLTQQLGSQAARLEQVQVAVGPAQGGGGSKLPWLLVGLGGGFAGGYLYQKSKTSETPANRPPTAGGVAASPSTGLMGVTNVAFSVAGPADPDGDALTFSWNFGDGQTGTGTSPTHPYNSAGTFTVTVTVGDGKGATASSSGSVTIKSLTGIWVGALTGNQVFNTTMTLTQTGANISGTYADQLSNSGVVETGTGVISSTGVITMSIKVGTNDPFVFSGTASADFNTLTGTANGSGFVNTTWVLTRQ